MRLCTIPLNGLSAFCTLFRVDRPYSCKRPIKQKPSKINTLESVSTYYHQYSCVKLNTGAVICDGQTATDNIIYSPGKPSGWLSGEKTNDTFEPEACEKVREDDMCYETCMLVEWTKERTQYGIGFQGTDCQEYDDSVRQTCRKKCPKEKWEKALWGK